MGSGKSNWEKFGKKNPYYWVTTDSRYKDATFNDDARQHFFESADRYLDDIFKVIRTHVDARFNPTRAFDFGCGVGRITIPLARRCSYVFGVDVAESMVAEARANSAKESLHNVEFATTIDEVPKDTERFDFIHSIYVLQHIRIKPGLETVSRLLDLLKDNGVGMLHFTYHAEKSLRKKLLYWLSVHVPLFRGLNNIRKGNAYAEPMYEMNDYPLNQLLLLLRRKQCDHLYVRYTRDSSYNGIMLFFQKKRDADGDFTALGDVP